jgi:hypothetical protein
VDELWQRYRTFWTPVLIGLGVFLVGVIVVFIIDPDPADTALRVDGEAGKLKRMVQPTGSQISAQREDARVRKERVDALAKRLDQVGPDKDVIQASVEQALTAAVLRGTGDADAFDGDAGAAQSARSRYDRMVRNDVDLLRTGDPNVGFGRLLADVWSELRVRANRADVDLDADELGFTQVTSVTRASLGQRLLNLALAARVVDAAVRAGVRSVDDVRFETRANGGPDSFILEWPVTFVITGTFDALRPVLELLADPAHTTPILNTAFQPPRRQGGAEGLVEMTITASSIRIHPDAPLDLASEELPR